MQLPKWSTPERREHLVALFNRSRGFCIWGERMCTLDAHSYEVFIEGLIWEWVREDREADAFLWKLEQRRIHQDEHTRRLGRQFDSIARERFLEQQGLYYLEGLGFNPLSFKRVAVIRIPSSHMRLLVDVTSAIHKTSKNRRRRIWRHGDTPPIEVARRIDYLCRQGVRAYMD